MNNCDNCNTREQSQDLIWLTAEDFEPIKGEVVPAWAYKQFDALCLGCYEDLINGLIKEGQNMATKEAEAKKMLEYIRGEIQAERVSMGELASLVDLIPYIEAGDVELLEWAGVPEEHADSKESVLEWFNKEYGVTQ